MKNEWEVGEYIIYQNGEKYELGRIKSIREDGCSVAYHEGVNGAKTPFSHMHKLINAYTISNTTLAWEYFRDGPKEDLVAVMRCKDCRFLRKKTWCNEIFCGETGKLVSLIDYCSRGERREDGERD